MNSLETSPQQQDIFSSRLPFKASPTALGLMAAAVLLVILLVVSIVENIHSARSRMEGFLQQKGETIVMAVEAGMRTSMMHFLGDDDPLQTLITESSRENDIAFIRIIRADGTVVNQAGQVQGPELTDAERQRILASETSVVHMDKNVFALSKHFHFQSGGGRAMPMMRREQRRLGWGGGRGQLSEGIVTVGLLTTAFDQARRHDVQHALLMGGVLFLVGGAGLYFLTLYQGMRVAQLTLANVKLYTDNVIESIPVGVMTLDTQERIVSCNRRIEELLGFSLEKCKGKTLGAVLPGWPVNCAQICRTGLEQSCLCSIGNGRSLPVNIGGSTLANSLGEVIGTVLIIRDMSQIKDMEQQLERSRRMAALGKMAAGIAHEIRNPLGTLRGFAHYFGNQAGEDSEGKGYAELMISEVDRLNRTVAGLLQFARPREPQLVPVVLDQLLGLTAALMEGDFNGHGLKFLWQCDSGICFDADPDLLLQVFMNLLLNSVHATPSGGEIRLKGWADDFVRISVTDTGCGMTDHERERMFDPFFSTGKTGTGLGLAVSHQIVEQHGGHLEVNTAPGEGTTVTVVLQKMRRGADGSNCQKNSAG